MASPQGGRAAAPSRFNTPRPIFLGWTALIFIAGFGYYTVKTRNTAKKKAMMRAEDTDRARRVARQQGKDEEQELAKLAASRERMEQRQQQQQTEQQSPLQSLLGQINKQTSQRRRATDES